jgi:hypothetical protein
MAIRTLILGCIFLCPSPLLAENRGLIAIVGTLAVSMMSKFSS